MPWTSALYLHFARRWYLTTLLPTNSLTLLLSALSGLNIVDTKAGPLLGRDQRSIVRWLGALCWDLSFQVCFVPRRAAAISRAEREVGETEGAVWESRGKTWGSGAIRWSVLTAQSWQHGKTTNFCWLTFSLAAVEVERATWGFKASGAKAWGHHHEGSYHNS